MAPKQRAANALSPLFSDSSSICLSCRRSIALRERQTRSYASAAPASVESSAMSPPPPQISSNAPESAPETSSHPRPAYALQAGVVLSRPPMLTRTLHPFEKAFFLYQRRLNERLALPFTQYFYFKKGTPANLAWKRKIKERLTPARDIGVYNAYGKEGWNDEVLVGDKTAEPDVQRDLLVQDMSDEDEDAAGASGTSDAPAASERKKVQIEKPADRVTAADRSGDERSLNRLGERTLYLLVKSETGAWILPSSRLIGRENLHQAAERIIVQAGGPNMNTWVVGNAPVGHYAANYPSIKDDPERGTKEIGEKTFFLKGRIMAGQANLANNKLGLADFKWLAKEEIQRLVTPRYWSQIANMLAER